MKKKLKFFKFITNIFAVTSLTLSVFGPLWHFQNTKNYSDFKLETRDIDLSNSKKTGKFWWFSPNCFDQKPTKFACY
ncbi:hypothetical protein R7V41_00080 [Mesomycoplasma ovipneumoniae]|uniref:hypothetical protein n=1 Tax=Mesomycoplasma ovipneumoniae TaxID=29562 RepID=UPI0029643166|nr:hypothetical protein [Mesomycoplasma ovipneumoniae]MDW2913926.1 hypothetical protein [Mesomycoplasma ovipneumoniae]